MPEKTTVPPVLYVPIRRTPDGGVAVVRMPMGQGRAALVAYTALDRLAKGCGEGQEWTLIFTSTLDEIKEEAHFDAVAFDVDFPDGLAVAVQS